MAYSHSKYELCLAGGAAASGIVVSATGNLGREFSAGYVPHIIRGASLRITTVADGTVKLRKWDSGSSGTLTTVAAFTLTTATFDAVGEVAVRTELDQEVQPGEIAQFVVTSAGAAGAVVPSLYVEPRWELPTNVSGVTLVTA